MSSITILSKKRKIIVIKEFFRNLIDIAKSQIEFMKTQLCEQLSSGTNPFEAKYVKFNKDFNYGLLEQTTNKKVLISNYQFLTYGPLQVLIFGRKNLNYFRIFLQKVVVMKETR